jgi:hypothetical protein
LFDVSVSSLSLFVTHIFFFGGTGVRTRGFMLARQVLYCRQPFLL